MTADVASTDVVMTTNVASTDVASTDVASTDVASTDVASTDVASTDVASTDVASTDVVMTADVASTDVSSTDASDVIERYLSRISDGDTNFDPNVYKLIIDSVKGPLPNMTYSQLQSDFRIKGGYITPSSFIRLVQKRCFFTNKPKAGSIDRLDRSIGYIAGNIVPASPDFIAYRKTREP
jgi:hypothetical protein